MKKLVLSLMLLASVTQGGVTQARETQTQQAAHASVWSVAKAKAWYQKQGWMTGTNFIPSTAINQLEMWQAATFDPQTIDRELGWAENLGFNTMRVFLHHLAWQQDRKGFLRRVNEYLTLADRHNLRTIFVIFDDCWNKEAQPGPQPQAKPGVHNSGWVQDPGDTISRDPAKFAGLQKYVTDVLTHFGRDKRVVLWDLYNEPGNSEKGAASLPLLRSVFKWARGVNPEQPLTAGLWSWTLESLNSFQAANSDVITYHNYEDTVSHQRTLDVLRVTGRPLICTEYMARTKNSRFANILPLLKKEKVGAINWGLVDGKTNTKYAWNAPQPDGAEPEEWFHEVFHKDGTPYRQDEVDLIKQLNSHRDSLSSLQGASSPGRPLQAAAP